MLERWLNIYQSMFKIGDKWTKKWVITHDIQQLFVKISKDKNPMHLESAFAKKNGFSDKIVHGNVLNCFISFFVGEMLPVKTVILIEQNIKYYNPCYVGDALSFTSKLTNIKKSTKCIFFDYSFKKSNYLIAKGVLIVKEL